MESIHLFTPVCYATIGTETSFVLYLSAGDITFNNEQLDSSSTPLLGTKTYFLSNTPILSSSPVLELVYTDTSSVTLTSTSMGVYNNEERVILTNGLSGNPKAYLDINNGRIDIELSSTTMLSSFNVGADRILMEQYIVPEYFSSSFKANLVAIDYGDGTIETRTYNGLNINPYEPFLHTYENAGTYNISVTAHPSSPFSSTLTKTFNNIIEVVDDIPQADASIFRLNKEQIFQLPHPNPRVYANSWVSADEFNYITEKINDNIEYILNLTEIYRQPPLSPNGYLTRQNNKIKWYTDSLRGAISSLSGENIDFALFNPDSNNAVLCDSNVFRIYDYQYNKETSKGLSVPREGFISSANITAIEASNDGKVFLLDNLRLKIDVYGKTENEDSYTMLYGWGSLGGVTGKYGFYKPTDIFIYQDRIFVADSGNSCIKEYTLAGNWENTFTLNNHPEKIHAGEGFILTSNNKTLTKIDRTGKHIFSLELDIESNILGMVENKGFIYILTKDKIYRLFATGDIANSFADKSNNFPDYVSISKDSHNNLYVNNGVSVIRYTDTPYVYSSVEPNIPSYTIPQILEEDFVSTIQYNKVFERLYLIHQDIYDRLQYIIDFDENSMPYRRPLRADDKIATQYLPYSVEDFYVGLNEFVTPEVINRSFSKLYECQLFLLDVLLP